MMGRESKSEQARHRLSGTNAVHDATRAAQMFSRDAKLDERDRTRLSVIVEELVTNLYEHGGVTAAQSVELELLSTNEGVTLVLIDPGQAFDPLAAGADGDVMPERGGGAGLKLVRAWARNIDYRVLEGRNRLTLLLPRTDLSPR